MKIQLNLLKARWLTLLVLTALAGSASAIELNGNTEQAQLHSILCMELDRAIDGESDYDDSDLAFNTTNNPPTTRLYRNRTQIQAHAANSARTALPQIRAPPLS